MNITYSKPLTAVVRALGLQAAARRFYYTVNRPSDGYFPAQIMGRTCKFRTNDPIELRTVELAVLFERSILELILSEIRSGDLFLDVGANLGAFAVFAASFGARVVACEPEPMALDRLAANREANQLDFQIVANALSDKEGTVSFAALAANQIIQHSHISETGTYAVKCIRGDSLNLQPNIVKVDVEGHEIHVLRGLEGSLDRCRLCVVEVHDGVDWRDVEGELGSCGFTRFERLEGKLIGRRA